MPTHVSYSPTVSIRIPEAAPVPIRGIVGGMTDLDAAVDDQLIARMDEHADLTQEAALPRGPERKLAVYNDLVETAARTQVDALAKLEALQAAGLVSKVESMFLPNAIIITAAKGKQQAVVDALAGVAHVTGVTKNKPWSIDGNIASTGASGAVAGAALLQYALDHLAPIRPASLTQEPTDFSSGAAAEWGVQKISAPAVWARGIDGAGVTIGVVDTGLESTHPAIAGHYRGTNADGSQSHDYNWFDPFALKPTPYDDGDHGTHVAGTSAGGSDSRATGVAPGAKLIAAKAINGSGYNTTTTTLQALQFMLAPTKTDGSDPDPTRGADVVNNSWGNADRDDRTFEETFAALNAAGIEVVTSAGNDGPRGGTVSPPGSYPGYFSIAASTPSDKIASFSSRGPSKFAAPGQLVPNLAAPGSNVTSSVPGGRYSSMSGTSMASPHVAGAVALLLQAKPQATHDELVAALEKTAVDIDEKGPDNAAGYGRIDVAAAVDYLLAH